MLIAVEGIHGCGKSTLIKEMINRLNKNTEITMTSWNSYETIHPVIYDLRLKGLLKDPLIYFFMQLSDFAFRHEHTIRKSLEQNHLVIADRYVHTAIVRGVVRELEEDYIRNAYSFSIKPDLTILLDIDPDEVIKRRVPSSNDVWMIGMGDKEKPKEFDLNSYRQYLIHSRDMYLELANKDNAIILDGLKSPDDLIEEVMKILECHK